jgi:hypothetical protein
MILPPHRGQARPRVVRVATSNANGFSSVIAVSVIWTTLQNHKDRTEDGDWWHQQDQHTDIEVADERGII